MSGDSTSISDELLAAAMESNEAFASRLKLALRQLGISAKDLSQGSGIPLSTINKIIAQGRDLRCSTLRDILKYVRTIGSQGADIEIGIIGTRQSLEGISKHILIVKGSKVLLKEFPASGLEDMIIGAIRAEREKIKGLICVPIVANIIEKFVRVPIMTVKVNEPDILDAVSLLVDKISNV